VSPGVYLEELVSPRRTCDACGELSDKTLRLCDPCADATRYCDRQLLAALKVAYHSMERGDEAGSPARTGALKQAREAILGAGGEL
jgi:hypothetical protein